VAERERGHCHTSSRDTSAKGDWIMGTIDIHTWRLVDGSSLMPVMRLEFLIGVLQMALLLKLI
jgi:hypothetical protein